MACPQPLPAISCPMCTYSNADNATQCEMCNTELNNKHNDTVTVFKQSFASDIMEQRDDDCPLEEDEDAMMDLTEYADPQFNKKKHTNVNNVQQNATVKTSATDTYNASILSDVSRLSPQEMDYDYDNNDMELQQVLNQSKIEQDDVHNFRRFGQHFESDQAMLEYVMKESLQTADNEKHYQNNSVFCDFHDLFDGYPQSANANSSNNNNNDDDVEVFEIHEPIHCDNIRKRKRQRNDIIQSPPKKTKRKDDIIQQNDEKSMNDIDVEYGMSDDIALETLSKKDRKRIESLYQKFLGFYLKGHYRLRTVCIEYGPKFAGRSAKFRERLSDTEWRPSSFALPSHMAFESCDNTDLPEFLCRFKHYTLNTDKRLIYRGANDKEELKKLFGKNKDGMATYFLPRLVNKRRAIYDKYVIVRLNWSEFKKIWCKQSNIYTSFDTLIERVKRLENVETINIILEDVAQKVTKIQNKRQSEEIRNSLSDVHNDTEEYSPFKDAQALKDTMMRYYFGDKRLHFTYTRNQKESAEYVVRAALTLAEHRFKKIRMNQLTVSDHNRKGIRGEKTKTVGDIFVSALVSMHNLSEKHASGIISKYPTIGSLMRKYKICSESEGEMLLADITVSLSGRRIGPAISRRVYDAFYRNMDGDKKMNA